MNFYDVHYAGHHLVGTSGGNTDDMREALSLMAENAINPAVMVTHVGGIESAKTAIYNLPSIPGGKKLIYTRISMPLVALDELRELGAKDRQIADLADIVEKHLGLWSLEAEKYLLEHARVTG
jgi:hypothetical protein